MSERGSVRFGNTTIDYEVRRSERRKKTVQSHRGWWRCAGCCTHQ